MRKLFATALLHCVLVSSCPPALASDVYKPGPLTEYCNIVQRLMVKKCDGLSVLKKDVGTSIALDQSGKIVDQSKEKSVDNLKFQNVIKSVGALPPPPQEAKYPFWLNVNSVDDPEKIEVFVKSLNYELYMEEMRRRLKRAWHPPAQKHSLRNTVKFVIYRNGHIGALKILTSSGVAEADQAAIAAVNSAEPLKPLPDGCSKQVDVEFTFEFNVNVGGSPVPEQEFSAADGAALCIKNGKQALESKSTEVAIQFFQRALVFEPNNVSAKENLSRAYSALGEYQFKTDHTKGLESFKKAREYWPENPMTPETVDEASKLFGK